MWNAQRRSIPLCKLWHWLKLTPRKLLQLGKRVCERSFSSRQPAPSILKGIRVNSVRTHATLSLRVAWIIPVMIHPATFLHNTMDTCSDSIYRAVNKFGPSCCVSDSDHAANGYLPQKSAALREHRLKFSAAPSDCGGHMTDWFAQVGTVRVDFVMIACTRGSAGRPQEAREIGCGERNAVLSAGLLWDLGLPADATVDFLSFLARRAVCIFH